MALFPICGNMGAGKTLTATFLLLLGQELGRTVAANYDVSFRDMDILDIDQILELKDAVVGFDEFWIWADARRSSRKQNIDLTRLLLQSRKRDLDIFMTAQHFSQIDVRARNVSAGYIFPQLDKKTDVCRVQIFDDRMALRRTFSFFARPIYGLYSTKMLIEELPQ